MRHFIKAACKTLLVWLALSQTAEALISRPSVSAIHPAIGGVNPTISQEP